MTPKRFPSKIDAWLVVLLVIAIGGVVLGFVVAVMENEDPVATMFMGAAMLLVVMLIVSLLFRTYYSVEGDTLRIVSGPFSWRVPIAEIEALEPTRSPLSSPALSLDRLRIRYSGKKSIMISPADKQRFARALGVEISRK
ncbi:MAG: PH domain-containing protein [Woeseiaceae bacterium]|nr:PH domain-containing protein [Woeseiaceae bacterium]